jgi:hypothetical protein
MTRILWNESLEALWGGFSPSERCWSAAPRLERIGAPTASLGGRRASHQRPQAARARKRRSLI